MTRRRATLFVVALWAVGVAGGLAARPAWPIDETRYLAVAWEMYTGGDLLVLDAATATVWTLRVDRDALEGLLAQAPARWKRTPLVEGQLSAMATAGQREPIEPEHEIEVASRGLP